MSSMTVDELKNNMGFMVSIGKGWHPIVNTLLNKIASLGIEVHHRNSRPEDKYIYIDQIKEKFGGLRFYYSSYGLTESEYQQIERLVAEAESKAANTCEKCGTYIDEPINEGWVYAMCGPCYDKRRC